MHHQPQTPSPPPPYRDAAGPPVSSLNNGQQLGRWTQTHHTIVVPKN